MQRTRPFAETDAPAVATIYNQAIAQRVATFETEPRTAATIALEFARRAGTHPAIVVERDGTVVAVAWTSEYRPRRAYARVAEVSVYVASEDTAGWPWPALIDAAERQGFWKLVSRIFPENAVSRRLCAALGFREVGIYRRHGQLANFA